MQLLQAKTAYVSKLIVLVLVFQTCSLFGRENYLEATTRYVHIWKIIIEGGYLLFTANLEGCMKKNPLRFVLGPVLFNIFITHLPYEIWMMHIKFADA